MGRMNFVNLRYFKNLTKLRKAPTSTFVKKSIYYYGYGTEVTVPDGYGGVTVISPEEPRGDWYSRDGEENFGDVMAWASGSALNHKYTYTMVLSLRDGQIEPEDFIAAMETTAGAYFSDYRLIVHYDTEHDHAHVVAFRDKTFRREEFNDFRLAMRKELEQLEEKRLEEMAEMAAERSAARKDRYRQNGISIDDEMAWEDGFGL